MTDRGSDKLLQVTSHNIDHRLAIIVNGRVISAPTIRSPLRGAVLVDAHFTRQQAEQTAAEINRAASLAHSPISDSFAPRSSP